MKEKAKLVVVNQLLWPNKCMAAGNAPASYASMVNSVFTYTRKYFYFLLGQHSSPWYGVLDGDCIRIWDFAPKICFSMEATNFSIHPEH